MSRKQLPYTRIISPA